MHKVSINGGLGNQMFQYALAISLNKKGRKARISFSKYVYIHYHNGFNLGKAFNLQLPFHLHLLNFFLLHGKFIYRNRYAGYFIRELFRWYNYRRLTAYREKSFFEFDDALFNLPPGVLEGTWQVEDYFREIRSAIINSFIFKAPRDKINKDLIKSIRSKNAVSIHIRRGDYLHSVWEQSHLVIKDNTYYLKAVDHIMKNVENPFFFIFSDDLQWARENVKPANCIYVDHNKNSKSYIDMYLMSLCKHNIIANSTFSWWGAWLNKNEEKIVIMPGQWVHGLPCSGIYAKGWLRMDV